MDKLPSQPILGIVHGMEVLQLLASSGRELSGSEISKSLNIEKTKVSRILKTLAHKGFAKSSVSRKYELGPAIHVLSAQILYGSKLIKSALKYLMELTELNSVVAMGVLWKDKVAYSYHWEPNIGIEPIGGLGRVELFPATQSSVGMVLLSEKTDEEIKSIIDLDKPIPGFDSKEDFFKSITNTRKLQYGCVINDRKSISVKVGKPTKAAVALSFEKGLSIKNYLVFLRESVSKIEAAIKSI